MQQAGSRDFTAPGDGLAGVAGIAAMGTIGEVLPAVRCQHRNDSTPLTVCRPPIDDC
jgi:hypothetical protein